MPRPLPKPKKLIENMVQMEEAALPPAAESFPTTMGEAIDLYYTKRAARLELEKEVQKAKSEEEAIKQYLLTTFGQNGLDGAKGKIATASATEIVVPTDVDWPMFHKYVRKENAFELLERRIAKLAWRERYESGVLVPGTSPLTIVNLSVVKASRK